MKVLEIGPSTKPQAPALWPDAEIDTLDANPEIHATFCCDALYMPEQTYGQYDHIFASHVLEHFHYADTVRVLQEWGKALKPGGHLHIIVPSLEWAARQVLAEHSSPALMGHLYAGQVNEWDFHKAGFTMRHLRAYMEHAGYAVIAANTGRYLIAAGGKNHEAEQHYMRGVKL